MRAGLPQSRHAPHAHAAQYSLAHQAGAAVVCPDAGCGGGQPHGPPTARDADLQRRRHVQGENPYRWFTQYGAHKRSALPAVHSGLRRAADVFQPVVGTSTGADEDVAYTYVCPCCGSDRCTPTLPRATGFPLASSYLFCSCPRLSCKRHGPISYPNSLPVPELVRVDRHCQNCPF